MNRPNLAQRGEMDKRLVWGVIFSGLASLTCASALLGQGPPPLFSEEDGPPASAKVAEKSIAQGYVVPAADLDRLVDALQDQYQESPEVRIAADKRTRQVVVVGPASIQAQVKRWINAQVKPAGAPVAKNPVDDVALPADKPIAAAKTTSTHPLRHLSARDFELGLAKVWGRRASFTTNESESATQVVIPLDAGTEVKLLVDHERDLVTVTAPTASQKPWQHIIQAMDSPRRDGATQAELVPLNRAEPAKIQRAVDLIRAVAFPEGSSIGRRHIGEFVSTIFQQEEPAGQPAPAGGAQPPGDAQPNPADGPKAEDEGEDDGSKIGPVQIEFVEGLDVVILKGKKKDVERVRKIIAQIEAESEKTKPEVELYAMQNVEDRAMNTLITQIYDQVFSARQGRVNITPLGKPNALLLVGRKEAIAPVLDLIKRLDQPVAPDTQLRVFPLKNLSAIDGERALRVFFTDQPGQQNVPRPGLGVRVGVIADYRSNKLVVQASPRDMEEVASLLEKLDSEDGPVRNEIRVFRLRNSLAEELAPVLQEAIYGQQLQAQLSAAGGQGGQQLPGAQGQGQGAGGGGSGGTPTPARSTPKPTTLQFLKIDKNGQELLESGILSDMRIAADARANSLVVTGPAKSMELMAALIEQLDGLPAVSAQIKVFTVENGDATQLATMLQTLFGQQQGAQGGPQGFQSATGAGDNTLVPLRFSVDTRTNSIIASGNAGDLQVVYKILSRLDEGGISGRIINVYKLKNSTAPTVAQAVNDYLQNQQQLNQGAPNLISAKQVFDRAVIVVAEPISNSLIVSSTPKYYEEIKRIVEQLDKRQNMVAIQMLIAEVKLNDVEQLGIELGLQDSLLFDRGIGTVGFPFNNLPLGNNTTAQALAARNNVGTQGISSFGVGRTDATLGYGGLVLSASSDSVNVLVRALQQSQRLQVLSRPQLQTLENQAASIQVGSTVYYVTQTNVSNGVVSNSTTPTQVGIILQVTPRTNADGNILMYVDAQKSELGPESEGTVISVSANGTPLRVPQIKITQASTTVSTRSGQTVILGGLISRNQTEITRRVPYLGDVPVLGRLFRFDLTQVDRTELLIIMTPYILQSDEQQNWLNLRESERMSWCLSDVSNIHGEVPYITGQGPLNGPTSPLIFPDEMPFAPEALPPPVGQPGITPPPMGPLPKEAPPQDAPPQETKRRGGPMLQPISLVPRPPEENQSKATPPQGAAFQGGIAPPSAGYSEPAQQPAANRLPSRTAPGVNSQPTPVGRSAAPVQRQAQVPMTESAGQDVIPTTYSAPEPAVYGPRP